MEVTVYVCPTDGCPDYVGYAGMGDLSLKLQGQHGMNNEPRPSATWFTRADCPSCRIAGRGRVQRIPQTISIERPAQIEARALA